MNAARQPITCFVAGTDTGVGKTFIAGGLLQAAAARGNSTAAVKPVASGCHRTPQGWRNDDALLLQEYCSVSLAYEQINPVPLPLAVAPHIAADQAGRRLDAGRLEGFCRAVMAQRAGLTVIEGAGGWRVPLNAGEHLSELAVRLRVPVVLVVGIRLGCINHALLTAEAIQRDGLELVGWVANMLEPDMPFAEENVATLVSLMPAPCMGQVAHRPQFDPRADCTPELDLTPLLG